MITNIKQFIIERNKNPKAFKALNESFDELEQGIEEIEGEDTIDDDVLTLESFTEMLNNAHEAVAAECAEGEECTPPLTADQIVMVFGVVEGLLSETTAEDEDEDEDTEDEDMPTEIEEGLGNFMRGGTKEEIEAKKKEITNKFQEIQNKYKGSTLLFKAYGGNDKPVPFNLADALKVAGKNNYLGTIEVIKQGDKMVAMYRDGKKGMNKVAAGTKAQTQGV